jgi:hypothetical protein
MEAIFKMELQWKEFNVDLGAIDASLRATYPHFCGNQAHNLLELWFTEVPSQDDQDAIKAMWDGLHEASSQVVSYKSEEQIKAASDAKRASAKAKLLELGLDADELKALLG